MLNELDIELSKRGLNFVRYADDCNIYVKSRKAANRVIKSITRFIEEKLKLKVNRDKSTVDKLWRLKFLGFSFYPGKNGCRIKIHPKSVNKFKAKLKELTSRSNAMNMGYRFLKLKQAIVGWVNYYTKSMKELDKWLRRRVRMCFGNNGRELKQSIVTLLS